MKIRVYGAGVGDELTIRAVAEDDVETLFGLILELAAYEKLSDEVSGDAEILRRSLFDAKGRRRRCSPRSRARRSATRSSAAPSRPSSAGAGSGSRTSTCGPRAARHGVGRALFARVAALAVERGFPRVEWAALDWNELALGFYDRLGARRMDEWRMLRLDGEALARLGSP